MDLVLPYVLPQDAWLEAFLWDGLQLHFAKKFHTIRLYYQKKSTVSQ